MPAISPFRSRCVLNLGSASIQSCSDIPRKYDPIT
ncbi:unnamed protein product, partial [Brassica oleracea var. botrytis]